MFITTLFNITLRLLGSTATSEAFIPASLLGYRSTALVREPGTRQPGNKADYCTGNDFCAAHSTKTFLLCVLSLYSILARVDTVTVVWYDQGEITMGRSLQNPKNNVLEQLSQAWLCTLTVGVLPVKDCTKYLLQHIVFRVLSLQTRFPVRGGNSLRSDLPIVISPWYQVGGRGKQVRQALKKQKPTLNRVRGSGLGVHVGAWLQVHAC